MQFVLNIQCSGSAVKCQGSVLHVHLVWVHNNKTAATPNAKGGVQGMVKEKFDCSYCGVFCCQFTKHLRNIYTCTDAESLCVDLTSRENLQEFLVLSSCGITLANMPPPCSPPGGRRAKKVGGL